jgi:uncharacterized protein YbbC (DUF1343 family)
MKYILIVAFSFSIFLATAQKKTLNILPGAYQTEQYLPLLNGKKVAVFANHTATINSTHIVDSLQKLGVNIVKSFGPEHGFRGNADAGEKVDTYIDAATKIQVISLYGKKRKPSAEDMQDVDVLVFDIQDVGVRFYTFISSLQEFIETAIEYNKPLIVFDRPNPNGFYVDGPVLDTAYKSFVGMQPIPVVYGMTIGEYAKMLVGERWLAAKYNKAIDNKVSLGEMLGFENERKNFSLTIISCKNYTHKSLYELPIKPSPNLPDMATIYWYASTCYFEGTVLSEGRGTDHPFCIFGHPSLKPYSDTVNVLYEFTPTSRYGAKEPKLKDKVCYGWNVYDTPYNKILKHLNHKIDIEPLVKAYKLYSLYGDGKFYLEPKSGKATDYFFNKLVGNATLMEQLKQGLTAKQISKSWQPAIAKFKKIRKKYLLYKDFE